MFSLFTILLRLKFEFNKIIFTCLAFFSFCKIFFQTLATGIGSKLSCVVHVFWYRALTLLTQENTYTSSTNIRQTCNWFSKNNNQECLHFTAEFVEAPSIWCSNISLAAFVFCLLAHVFGTIVENVSVI